MGQDNQVGESEIADMKAGDEKIALSTFDTVQAKDLWNEKRVMWSEVGTAVILALMAAAYLAWRFAARDYLLGLCF